MPEDATIVGVLGILIILLVREIIVPLIKMLKPDPVLEELKGINAKLTSHNLNWIVDSGKLNTVHERTEKAAEKDTSTANMLDKIYDSLAELKKGFEKLFSHVEDRCMGIEHEVRNLEKSINKEK